MNYSRRKFIGTAAAGMGAMMLHPHITCATPLADAYYDPYEIVEIGQTGIKTTRLCMGTGINTTNRQTNLTRLGHEQAVKFVREMYERGVRMFDMADSYGTHACVGEALKIYPRNSYILFSKLWYKRGKIPEGVRPGDETEAEVTRFLKELQTDYLDGLQLHYVTSLNWNTELSDYMTEYDKLKQKGIIRSHGLSCHALPAVETAVHEPWVDTIHVRFNAYGDSMDTNVEEVEPVVKLLHQAGRGVIAIKVIGEGAFSNSDEKRDNTFRFVLQTGAVDILNIGMDKLSDIVDSESRIRKVLKIQI